MMLSLHALQSRGFKSSICLAGAGADIMAVFSSAGFCFMLRKNTVHDYYEGYLYFFFFF